MKVDIEHNVIKYSAKYLIWYSTFLVLGLSWPMGILGNQIRHFLFVCKICRFTKWMYQWMN